MQGKSVKRQRTGGREEGRKRETGIGKKEKGREKGEGKGEKFISQRPEKRQDRALS